FAKESHEIQLTGLEPATRYYYRLYHDQQVFRDGLEYWFETAPEKGSNKSVRLWVIGNPGANSQNSHLVQNGMLKWIEKNPRSDKSLLNMIISTGNNAYDDASNDEYQKYLFSVQEDLFKNFVFWPTYGEIDANGWAFFNIFSLPKNAESGGVASDSERYYSVDYGSLHMIFLDSYEGAYTAEDDMLRWLKKDLKNTNQKWVITYMNHAPYTRGSHNSDDHRDSSNRMFNMRKHVIPLLEDAGVDMVITGHSYSYERSYLVNCHYGVSSDFTRSMIVQKGPEFIKPGNKKSHQGAVYTVLGSSALSADGRFDHPVMATSSVETGSMIIDLEKEKLSAYFINDKAEVIDQFEITKNLTAPIYKSQCQ
ncbi:MAG: metallophosphoesterase family protein, partial [Gammaproteobacteria bacterium]|nr:metallophosphoesterase family protein [Gammaproteobacteria bacterium]